MPLNFPEWSFRKRFSKIDGRGHFVDFQVLSTVSRELRIRGNEALLPDDKGVQGTSQVTCRIGLSDNPTSVTLGSRCKTALISGLRFIYLVDEASISGIKKH
jgi:hypothetical protein